MSADVNAGCGTGETDPDIVAVRHLLAAEQETASDIETTDTAVKHSETQRSSVAGRLISAVRSYRPDRRSVLLTAAVLLVLLQPGLVAGIGLLILASVLLAYFGMGHEAFWARALGCFAIMRRWAPDTGRVLRVRLWVAARRWNRLTGLLPESLAQRLRLPDVRGIAAATERHDAVLTDRLSRL